LGFRSESWVCALGQIITNPAKNPLALNQEKYFLNKAYKDRFREKHSAYVEYSKVCLEKPLLQEECTRHSTLMEMQVFMKPQGTNFRITAEQWNKILELIDKLEK